MPTPLAKETDVPAIHLRLRKGLVSIVPIEKLEQDIRLHHESILRRLQSNSEIVETFGPIDGYRAKLKIFKRSVVVGSLAGQRQEYVLEPFTQFLPISDDIGQNIEQALLPGSMLHDYLESHRRESPPVEVWLYSDSFQEFQTLKRALRDWKYSIIDPALASGCHDRLLALRLEVGDAINSHQRLLRRCFSFESACSRGFAERKSVSFTAARRRQASALMS